MADRRRVLCRGGGASSTSARQSYEGAEHRVGEALGVPGWEFFVEYHAAQVKRAAKEILGEFESEVRADFTALDGPSEHLRAGLASGINEAFGENCREV